MKKYLFPILFILVLVLPALVSRLMKRDTVAAVVPAGALPLDIISPNNQDIRNAFAGSFSKWHEAKYGHPVALKFVNVGGTGDITRLLNSNYQDAFKRGGGALPPDFRPPFDVVWGGGDAFFDRDIKAYLQGISLPPGTLEAAIPKPILNGVRLYDYTPATTTPSSPKWIGYCISSFGIVYNPDVYSRLNLPAPQAWNDLAREELTGWIALANPTSSSSAATAYSMDFQRAMADAEAVYLQTHPELAKLSTKDRMKDPGYMTAIKQGWHRGMGELLLVAANARYITDSGSQPPNDVANGDAAAAMAIDFYGRANEFTMGEKRFKLIFPRGAAAMNPDPVGILQGVKAERLETANHFVEYLLTPEGQRQWQLSPAAGGPPRPLFRSPIRPDVYADRTGWTNPSVNPYEDTSGFFMRSEWMSLFYEIRWFWAVSWIDAGEDLKAAEKAILHNPDPARRKQLRQQLADFPFTYDDLLQLRKDLADLPKSKVEEERAKRRIDWAAKFRQHYRAVAAAADAAVAVR